MKKNKKNNNWNIMGLLDKQEGHCNVDDYEIIKEDKSKVKAIPNKLSGNVLTKRYNIGAQPSSEENNNG